MTSVVMTPVAMIPVAMIPVAERCLAERPLACTPPRRAAPSWRATHAHVCSYAPKALDLLRRQVYDVGRRWLTTHAESEALKAEHPVRTTPPIRHRGLMGFARDAAWR